MKVFFAILSIIAAAAETLHAQQTDSLDKLAADFWTWRARYALFTGDDVNRIERPGGMRDWSRAKIDSERKELGEFETRWKKNRFAHVADREAGRLQVNRLGLIAGAMGAGH
jgi:hypothetical protein